MIKSLARLLIPVGIAIIGIVKVKYDLVSKSKPTIDVWYPRTIHPNTAISIWSINISAIDNYWDIYSY